MKPEFLLVKPLRLGLGLPWEETDQYIRSGHRSPHDFEPDSFRTITLSEDEGLKAIVGKPKGKDTMEVQSYLFDKSKGWTLEKAKEWFEKHKESLVKGHYTAVFPFTVLEKVVDKPLRIKGVAIKAGVSRNLNIYTPEELECFTQKLAGSPVYVEHVAVPNAVGKVVRAWWDPQSQAVLYEAEIYDEEIAEKIRKGLIQHVSVGADYETIDILDGKVPHGLHNAELSLVAVPGVPETNIQVLESLQSQKPQVKALEKASFPLHAAALVDDFRLDGREYITSGEYILGFHRDPYAFLPEHFSTVWLDRENGILALVGRLRNEPEKRRIQAILFARERWDEPKIRDWFLLHPHYLIESASAPTGCSGVAQKPLKEHGEKMSSLAKQDSVKCQEWQSDVGKSVKVDGSQNRVYERVWSTKYINDLPDSAFAIILPGGDKDEEGKTKPRSLRKFPHHTADGKIDLPHLRNANARASAMLKGELPRGEMTEDQLRQALKHLAAHKKALGIGMAAEEAKLVEQEPVGEEEFEVLPEATLDEVIADFEDNFESFEERIAKVEERLAKVEERIEKLEQSLQAQNSEKTEEKSEKPKAESVAEQLLAKSPREIELERRIQEALKEIPPEGVIKSWRYPQIQPLRRIRYILTGGQSSNGQGVGQDELAETKKLEKGE